MIRQTTEHQTSRLQDGSKGEPDMDRVLPTDKVKESEDVKKINKDVVSDLVPEAFEPSDHGIEQKPPQEERCSQQQKNGGHIWTWCYPEYGL